MSTLPEELQQSEGPWLPRAFLAAAKHYEAGFLDEARQLLVKILEHHPLHADSMFLMASIAGQSSDLDLAEDLLKQALAIDPQRAPFWVLLGNVLQRRSRLPGAVECYAKAIQYDPTCAEAHYELGNTLESQGNSAEATRAFVKTLALRHDHLEARIKLAVQYKKAGRLDESLKLLELARGLAPRSVPVLVNLAGVYVRQRRHQDALGCLDHAIASTGDSAALYTNKGNVLLEMGKLNDALEAFQAAIGRAPDSAEAWVHRGRTLRRQGRPAEALESFRKALELDPGHGEAHSAALHTMQFDPETDAQSLVEEHRLWADRYGGPLQAGRPAHANSPDPERRLRIGYLLPDPRRHSIAYLLARVLERHSAHAFCYATGSSTGPAAERLRAGGAVWREAAGLDDAALAAQIRNDLIDILVDLSGHTPGNRLPLFARRPAPVAMSWLGYRHTTGLKDIDYLLVDGVVAPEDEPAPFVETPLRLDGCFLVYSGPGYAPAPTPPPCLQTGHITYGCFAALEKITPSDIELWSRLLHADRRAHLMLKTAAFDDPPTGRLFLQQFTRRGIEAGRIGLWGSSPHGGLLAWHANVDIALDPFPFNGVVTTCEALWMGVPVITLSGGRFLNRVGASLLSHAGLSDWITRSPEEYVERALTLGADTEILRRIRMLLRDQVHRSSLGDAKAFVRRLEDAYRTAWRRYCASRQPSETRLS